MAVTMKNAIFWDVAPCSSCVNHLQLPAHADFSTLKMEAIRSSETLVHTGTTRRHIPEDGILDVYCLPHNVMSLCYIISHWFIQIM
jgi:hypothetical protein